MTELKSVLKKENETPEEEYARLGFNYYRHPFLSAKRTPYTKAEKKAVYSSILKEAFFAGEYIPGQKGTYKKLEDFCNIESVTVLPDIDVDSIPLKVTSQILTDFFRKNTWQSEEKVIGSYFFSNREYLRELYTSAGFDYKEIEERLKEKMQA